MQTGKCVHKGCGKVFSDPDEPCVYHPGPPEFHEGQKGWKCCKPRVLTFDEFLEIPPCTTGKHSTVDDTPAPSKPAASNADLNTAIAAAAPAPKPIATTTTTTNGALPRLPQQARSTTPVAPGAGAGASQDAAKEKPENDDDSDDPERSIPEGVTCKRRGCGATYAQASLREAADGQRSDAEQCTHHPGQPIFHEGSKGWTCCKRRVLEFDEFMRIPGCQTKPRHCFVGGMRKKRRKLAQQQQQQSGAADTDSRSGTADDDEYERVATVRHDFYQTATSVHASVFLKKIDPKQSSIEFVAGEGEGAGTSTSTSTHIQLDLRTSDAKRYEATLPLYAAVQPAHSSWKILGTKLELTLAKADVGFGWPVFRADDKLTGEIIQTGRAGLA